MPSQTKPCPATAANPWGNNSFVGDYAPVSGIWTLNGVYESLFWDNGSFNEVAYSASDLGFSSIGSAVITLVTVTAYGVKTDGLMTQCHVWPSVGMGTLASYSIQYDGTDDILTLSTTPQTVVATFTPSIGQSDWMKARMADPDFLLSIYFNQPNVSDNFYVDYMDFKIDYAIADSTFRNRGGDNDRLPWGVR